MKRRSFLAGAATATFGNTSLAQPAVVAKAKTLIHVPQANLTSLDPVWTTALVTRNYAAMVFETLMAATSSSIRSRRWSRAIRWRTTGCAGRCDSETVWRFMMAKRCWRATALPHCNAG